MEIIDIYGEKYSEQHTKVREACRGIVIKDGRSLLTYREYKALLSYMELFTA
ncbi:MAG: hypothetical protein IJZ55_04545 [Lachnospiraceae bacterium]|nr:hypothetical protein [Lachnospiraceae bacterium]